MIQKLLFLYFFFLFLPASAQQYFFGNVFSEDQDELPEVLVINMRTDERTETNREGHFMISGKPGDRLRFLKTGYDSKDEYIPASSGVSMRVTLFKSAQLIEEVLLKRALSGNLSADNKTLNRPKKVEQLNIILGRYMMQKSSASVMAAKPGEFVQPVTKGIPIGKVKDQWDIVDLTQYIQKSLGDEYFTSLKIPKTNIPHFIDFVLRDFEKSKIIKYGRMEPADMQRFQQAVMNKILLYPLPK